MLEPKDDASESSNGEGQTIRERRRSSQISIPDDGREPIHERLPRVFSGRAPSNNDDSGEDEAGADADSQDEDSEEQAPGFLGRVTSYHSLMHAHTRSQMKSPANGTLPAYTKTMRAFTMNQLSHYRQTCKSETNSPQLGPKQPALPSKVGKELTKLSLNEVPALPVNTPERDIEEDKIEDVLHADYPAGRRRSLTEPTAVRDFAVVKERELGGVRAVAV